jgi:hypothetical protein
LDNLTNSPSPNIRLPNGGLVVYGKDAATIEFYKLDTTVRGQDSTTEPEFSHSFEYLPESVISRVQQLLYESYPNCFVSLLPQNTNNNILFNNTGPTDDFFNLTRAIIMGSGNTGNISIDTRSVQQEDQLVQQRLRDLRQRDQQQQQTDQQQRLRDQQQRLRDQQQRLQDQQQRLRDQQQRLRDQQQQGRERHQQILEINSSNGGVAAAVIVNLKSNKKQKTKGTHWSDALDTTHDTPGEGCVICMERQKKVFIDPCGHTSLCITCSKQMYEKKKMACPICRGAIVAIKETF